MRSTIHARAVVASPPTPRPSQPASHVSNHRLVPPRTPHPARSRFDTTTSTTTSTTAATPPPTTSATTTTTALRLFFSSSPSSASSSSFLSMSAAPSSSAVPAWKAATAGPVLSYRPPLSLDTLVGLLNSTLFKPWALLLLPFAAVGESIARGAVAPAGQLAATFERAGAAGVLDALRPVPATATVARAVFVFVLLLNLHRVATRYVKNLGVYRADPVDFGKDIVVVTGGAAGIGKAVVELLTHKHHAKVAVLDLAAPTYAPAPAGAPEILYIKTDVTSKEAVAAAAREIRAVFGADPAVLVNNAGLADGHRILDVDLAVVEKLWRVNTLAHYVTLQQFLPAMIAQNHGHVVSVASSASYMSLPQLGTYAMTKSGALAVHEALTGELRTRYNAPRVRTSVVCPTKVRTALGDALEDQANQLLAPTLEPVQVGQQIVSAIAEGNSKQIIMPAIMNVLPTGSRAPAWLRRLIELIGNTDTNVTDKSIDRAVKNGYGENIKTADGKDWFDTLTSKSK